MKTTTLYKSIILVLYLIYGVNGGKKIPDYLKPCKRHDKDLENCLKDSIQHTVSHMRYGIKGTDIRKLEPITLDMTTFNFSIQGVEVQAVMNTSIIRNLSFFEIISIRITENCYIIDITIPYAKLVSNGSLTTAYIEAEGELLIEGERIDMVMKLCGDKIKEKKITTFQFNELDIMLNFDDFNAEISCNNTIKEKLVNWGFAFSKQRILMRALPIIREQARTQLLETIKLLCDGYNYSELFPE